MQQHLTEVRSPTRRPVRAAALFFTLLAAAAARADEIKPFEATYAWIWSGMNVVVTTVKLEKTQDSWTYTSRSEPRGIGKLLSERPTTVSVLRSSDGSIEPLSYQGDDGTSSTKRRIDVKYDWTGRRVIGVYEDTAVDLALAPGVQDDSSVQVAMMAQLLHGRVPDRFSVLDKNSVREYRYTRDGEETLKTPFGNVATVIYRSQRANSPRYNRYWCAPDRGYIPMRVQQKRGDEVQWTMEIQSLKRE